MRLQDDSGTIPDDAWVRAKAQSDRLRGAEPFRPQAAGISRSTWTWLGPGNIGGRIRSIAIHPSTPSTIFIGSVGGGIWKSVDSGASWTPINDFLSNLAISSIVFNPASPATMYAGTGEGFHNLGRIRGAGIFVSSDGGTTWTTLASTVNANFHYVNRVAIAANGATILAGTSVGLFRSINAGASWTKVLTPSGDLPDVLDVKFLPGSSANAVASGYSKNAFYTTDGGASWLPAAGLVPQAGALYRVEIGVTPSSPSAVYLSVDAGGGDFQRPHCDPVCGTVGNFGNGELWKSTDGGASYAVAPGNPAHFMAQGYFDNAIWVDPINPNRVVVGGTHLAATTDGGATWTRRAYAAGIPPDTHAIVHDPGYNGTTNKRVYVGNDSGIYVTNDITASPFTSAVFTSLNNGLGITHLYGAAGNVASGKIIAGAQDNGTLLYTPSSGTTWSSLFGFDGGYVASDPTDPNYFYGADSRLRLHRNTSGGAVGSIYIYGDASGPCKAAPYSITDACTGAANYLAPFVLDPNNANTILAGGSSLWRTTDVKTAVTATTGPTWTAIKPPEAAGNFISAVAIAAGNPDIIWVGHNSGAIYKTVNGTAASPSWVSIGSLPARYLSRIAIDANNHNIVYAAFTGFASPNLWKTVDGGLNWTSASGSGGAALPAAPIYSVLLHPTIPGWVYVGTEVGLFASTNGGATWSLPHDGPANVSIEELAWMGSSMLAATHGRGLFISSCSYTFSSPGTTVGASGGGGTVTVTPSSSSCAWMPSSNVGWLTFGGGGTGNGSFTFTAAANTGGPRTGIISIGGATFVVTQGASPTALSLGRAALFFGARNNGGTLTTTTSRQAVTVTFGATPWTATTTTPWLQIGGGAGTGSGQFTVSVVGAPGLPASGSVMGSITVTGSGATNGPQTIAVRLNLYPGTGTTAAYGSFDTPVAGANVAGSIAVTGWALDDIEVARVEIWRDKAAGETTPGYPGPGPGNGKVFIANAFFINGARPDVEAGFAAVPFNQRAGWGYLMLTWGLWNQGNGTFTLYAFAYDKEGNASVLGSKVITSSNATATRPFGSIDTPGYGETVSGTFWNFGWALTPNATPSCTVGPSGVQVSIDSGPLQPVNYGDLRPDIAGAFPGFTNGSSAGGAYYIDSTTLSNGTHSIGWFVTDSCGRADGIGSRFFDVLNGSSPTAVPSAIESAPASRGAAIRIDADRSALGDPVSVRRDVGDALVFPNPSGDRIVAINERERIEMRLPLAGDATYAGYQVVNGERRALPLGSTFDAASGTFYWQPAAGFLGAHDLEFVSARGGVVRVRAVIGTGVQGAIDTPPPGVVPSEFVIAGWAIDQAALSGTGIDTVHVWAYPAAGGSPIFLGVANYGDTRPDIGSVFGDQFAPASYSLVVPYLDSGTYDIVVYPHSTVTGDFRGAKVVRVRIR